jgi:hypothetical protein
MSSTPKTISGIPDPITVSKNQVRIVKSRDIVPSRRDDLFKDIDYLETQIGRLAKMAREIRAKALLLTTE